MSRTEQIAQDIEDKSSLDGTGLAEGVSWDDIDPEIREACESGIADKVAAKLEADGFGDAAEYVRAAQANGGVVGHFDLADLLGMLGGDDDDEGMDD